MGSDEEESTLARFSLLSFYLFLSLSLSDVIEHKHKDPIIAG